MDKILSLKEVLEKANEAFNNLPPDPEVSTPEHVDTAKNGFVFGFLQGAYTHLYHKLKREEDEKNVARATAL